MVPDPQTTSLGLEYFCTEGDDLWRRSDAELLEFGRREVEEIGVSRAADVVDGTVVRQRKAYPVYNGIYAAYLARIKSYLGDFENLQTVGRNGLHKSNNQDHSMLTAMLAVRNLLGESHECGRSTPRDLITKRCGFPATRSLRTRLALLRSRAEMPPLARVHFI